MCVYTYIYKLLRYKSQEHLPSLHWSKKHCEMGAFFPPASGLSICTEEPPSPDPGILSIIIPCGMSRINATYWSQLRWELYIPQEVLFVTPQALNLLMRPSMFLLQSTESKLLPVCLSRERNSSKANKNVQKKKPRWFPDQTCDKLKAMYYFLQVNMDESRNTTSKLQNGIANVFFSLFWEVQVGCI